MAILYEVVFKTLAEIEDETGTVDSQWVDGKFFLACENFSDAVEQANFYLSIMFEESDLEWDLVSVTGHSEIEILNVDNGSDHEYGDETKTECPWCAARKVELDRVMRFDCCCGTKVIVADNGWDWISCQNCGIMIERSEVQRIDGYLKYIPKDKK